MVLYSVVPSYPHVKQIVDNAQPAATMEPYTHKVARKMIRFTDPKGNDVWVSPPFVAVCNAAVFAVTRDGYETAICLPGENQAIYVMESVADVIKKYKKAGFHIDE